MLVVDGEDRLRFRDVDVLRIERDNAVIAGGLSAGERVCVSPLNAVSDGMKVRTSESTGREDATEPETGDVPQATANAGGSE